MVSFDLPKSCKLKNRLSLNFNMRNLRLTISELKVAESEPALRLSQVLVLSAVSHDLTRLSWVDTVVCNDS